jgi:hypothetical protein
MSIQSRISLALVLVLILLVGTSTGARSLAAIDDSLTRGKATWNAADSKQKQIETHNLEVQASGESSGRSVFGRIRHYVGAHKELLASDALFVAAATADTISSVHCVGATPKGHCYESNPLLPNYPSELAYWSLTSGVEAAYIAAIHVWWHRHPDSRWRRINWAVPIGTSIYEIPNVKDNYYLAANPQRRLQEARARVSR